jgi:hypothetical protein
LAAYFAAIPPGTERVELTLKDIEQILGEPLPPHARFPFWWDNEPTNVHCRAWLSSNWKVTAMDRYERAVVFERCRGTWSARLETQRGTADEANQRGPSD